MRRRKRGGGKRGREGQKRGWVGHISWLRQGLRRRKGKGRTKGWDRDGEEGDLNAQQAGAGGEDESREGTEWQGWAT